MRVEGKATSEGKAVQQARWLVMGAADPHGVGDIDKVKPGRVPALKLGSKSMAAGEELMLRPLPEANVAPSTLPIVPPEPRGGAPLVTRVDQVIPAHTQRLVANWRRELRHCLAAAARGAKDLARRLRPKDL